MTFHRQLALAPVIALIALSGCTNSKEARIRSAQPTANKYFEYCNVGDHEGAFRNTFGGSLRMQMPLEKFVQYRQRLDATSGKVKSDTLVEAVEVEATNQIRLTYGVDGANVYPEPMREVLYMGQENGEWKIVAIDVRAPGKPQPAATNTPATVPLPGPRPKAN